jgi:hypothetical protein
MTVYVDKIMVAPGGRKWCRLMGTELVELEDFAVTIGVPTSGYVNPPDAPRFYPLNEKQRAKALRRGARER